MVFWKDVTSQLKDWISNTNIAFLQSQWQLLWLCFHFICRQKKKIQNGIMSEKQKTQLHSGHWCILCVLRAKMCHSINVSSIEFLESLDSLQPRQSSWTHTHTHAPLYSSSIFIITAAFHRTMYPSERLKPFCLCSLNRTAALLHWKAAHKGGQIWTDAHFFLALTIVGSKDTQILCPSDQLQTRFPPKSHRMALLGAHSCIPMTILRNLWKEQHPSSGTLDVHQNPPFSTLDAPCHRPLCACPSSRRG